MRARRRRRELGLRREVSIFVPLALVVLVVLSTFTLFAHRSSLERLTEERRAEASRLAQRLAKELAAAPEPLTVALRRYAPAAHRLAVVAADGRPVAEAGAFPEGNLLGPLGGRAIQGPVGLGPGARLPEIVAGFAPLPGSREGRLLRVDFLVPALAAQRRSATVLTTVVLGVNAALTLLVLLFLRHLLAPYETLLERAREVGGEEGAEGEVAFLLSTFERALAALARPPGGTEEDLATLERALAPSLESGLLVLDRQGRLLALNPIGASLLDISPPPPGSPLQEALAGQGQLLSLLEEALAGERSVQREELTIVRRGEERTLGLTVHPLRRDDGTVRGCLVLFADLTEVRRQAEEERLEESLAQLGELSAGVAHELRNSVATLRGYLTLIERHPEEEALPDYLQEIRRETDHLQRVVEDFLSFTRPGTARLEELDLGEAVRRAAVDPTLAGVRVEVERAGPVPRVRGDRQLLERALRNLLHNAAAAQAEAGAEAPLAVRLAAGPDGVELAIADRGPGLPPAVRKRLFQPFVSARPGGVGLGLAVAHRIVTLHGGRLRLEDRAGGGIRAVISLPPDTFVTKGNDPPGGGG